MGFLKYFKRKASTVPSSKVNREAPQVYSSESGGTHRPHTQGSGFFPNAQSFGIHGGNFTDVSTRITQVYNGNNGLPVTSPSVGIDLLRQHMTPSALHNSANRFDAPKCDEDTRTGVIEEIMGWIQDPSTPLHILCMTGPAGTGKSALEQTIAEKCAELRILAGSFFFSVSDTSRNTKTSLIPTIAYQLAHSIDDVRDFIGNAVNSDQSVFEKTLEAQIDILIVQPFRKAAEKRGGRKDWPHVIMIDGLDECHGVDHQSHILSAIRNSLIKHDPHFRIVLASRPEYAIRTALKGHLREVAYAIELDDKYNPNHDIRLYLQRRLADLGRLTDVPGATDGTWPATADVEKLVENASGQFIYAATVVKFVSQRHSSPVHRLQLLLAWTPDQNQPRNPFAALDKLYITILSLAQEGLKEETDDPLSIVRLLNRIRTLEPELPLGDDRKISYLEQFPFLSPGEIQGTLSDLHALVKLAGDEITFHHKSFLDFLDSPSRSGRYYIDRTVICTELVAIFAKCITPEDTTTSGTSSNMFKFHSQVDIIRASYIWWDMVQQSTQDDSVLAALKQFNFERWIALIKLAEKTSAGISAIRIPLAVIISDINAKHTSSDGWSKIRAPITEAHLSLEMFESRGST